MCLIGFAVEAAAQDSGTFLRDRRAHAYEPRKTSILLCVPFGNPDHKYQPAGGEGKHKSNYTPDPHKRKWHSLPKKRGPGQSKHAAPHKLYRGADQEGNATNKTYTHLQVKHATLSKIVHRTGQQVSQARESRACDEQVIYATLP